MARPPKDSALSSPRRGAVVPGPLAFPVVGIGASAGGLQAVGRFFEHMPNDAGMAFVVVLHLSPHHQSIADRIIQDSTGMPVVQVTDTVPVERNHVYVISPGVQLSMKGGQLTVTSPPPRRGGRVAIDLFFRDLAEAHKTRAICVVLSGTGTDGAVGLARIKEHGGVTLVQSPDDAEYDGMPSNAINTKFADFVLPVVEIPDKILELWSNMRQIALSSAVCESTSPEQEIAQEADSQERLIQDILLQLRSATGHDFRHYKRATVLRRIERRLQVTTQPNLGAYYLYLQDHPEETKALLGDMLIGVTNFFRDREAFEALEREVIPAITSSLTAGLPREELRVWSAGCSTGEEAYSLAMLIADQLQVDACGATFQLFASDIDERAISTARAGLYPGAIVTDVPPARLRQYFVKHNDCYKVRKEVRERVLFAQHSLLTDPPFSQMDLIACRNLLIYLDREVQREILQTFHFALRPGGYLFLGSSESADFCPDLFTVVDKKNRLFRARISAGIARRPAAMPRHLGFRKVDAVAVESPGDRRRQSLNDVHRAAMERFAPPSLILDSQADVLHMTESAGAFLRHTGGELSRNLLALIQPELRLELRTALFQAQQNLQRSVSRPVPIVKDTGTLLVQVAIHPYQDPGTLEQYLYVVLKEADGLEQGTLPGPGSPAENAALHALERELHRTKVHLQETIEQAEISSEELNASNEEMQAVNEELRSATEELETSKEELQSINEELLTVNHELKTKVEETDKVNDYLTNLIASTDIATVFVDRAMRIKWFTPRATDIFSMIPADTGRSLLDITHRLSYPGLARDAETVFDTLSNIEREVSSTDGRWYIARLLPYRSSDGHIRGTVLTFIDITKRRAVEERFRAEEERLRLVAESTRDHAIFILDESGVITNWYRGAEVLFGYPRAEAEGRYFDFLYVQEDRAAGTPEAQLQAAQQNGRGEDERWHLRKDGSRVFCSSEVTSMRNGGLKGFVKIAKDETHQRQLNEAHSRRLMESQLSHQLKDEFFAVMSHELKHPLNLIQLNSELLQRIPTSATTPAVRKAIKVIREAVKGQARIIDDLLDVARVQTGKLNLNRQPVELIQVLRDIHALAEQSQADRSITLVLPSPVEPLLISADFTRVEQIIWNLISNAIKFTQDGGSIELRAAAVDGFAQVQVIDDGAGIEPDSQGSIFDMFGQTSSHRSWQERQGLGIGLSLVRQLVTAHGGQAQVYSQGIGTGTAFTVTFPLIACAATPASTSTDPVANTLGGLKILLVDDDPDVAEVLQLLLESEEGQVVAFSDPVQALEWARGAECDLLISDIGMPGMNGYELASALRGLPAWETVPMIALTGFGEAQGLPSAGPSPFSHRLGKPVEFEELVAILGQLSRHRQLNGSPQESR